MLTLAEGRVRDQLVILCYHRVLPAGRKAAYFLPDLVVTPDAFRRHCLTLGRHYDVLPLCQAEGVSVVIGTPYNSGILASDLSGPVLFNYQRAASDVLARARALAAVCNRHGVELKAAALQFVLAHPAVVSTIPGPSAVEQLEENVAMVGAEIPAALWDEMRAEGLLPEHAPTP